MICECRSLFRLGLMCAASFLIVQAVLAQDEPPTRTTEATGEETEWTWKSADGAIRTRAELDQILQLHSWWMTLGVKGEPADLSGADLTDVDFCGAFLVSADLHGADFTNANLGVDLTGAGLGGADLTDADMSDVDFKGVLFEPKSLPSVASLASARNLAEMRFEKSQAMLVKLRAELRDLALRQREREVNYALLKCRREQQSKKSFVNWIDAQFQYFFFELTCQYGRIPGLPLLIMGVLVGVFAIPYLFVVLRANRRTRSDIWFGVEHESIRPGRSRTRHVRVLANWGQPENGADKVGTGKVNAGAVGVGKHGEDKVCADTVGTSELSADAVGEGEAGEGKDSERKRHVDKTLTEKLARMRRAVCVSIYFSVLTAFRVGFREINVGNWITRIQSREYTLRATGWVRVVTGIQSLISVYLLALFLLTYFSRPFE